MNYQFKIADPRDIFAIHKLVNSAYRGESSKVGWTTEADLLAGQRIDHDALAELMEAPQAALFCATDSEKKEILACVHLKKENKKCYLGMLTVKPDLQNSGLGKIMMERSEQQARTWSCDSIFMTVISARQELIEFYNRRGFRLTGEKKPFPYGDPRFGIPQRPDLEFVVMEKLL